MNTCVLDVTPSAAVDAAKPRTVPAVASAAPLSPGTAVVTTPPPDELSLVLEPGDESNFFQSQSMDPVVGWPWAL